MYPAKTERNKRLIKLRTQNPTKWTYAKLAKEFNIARPTALKVFKREVGISANKVLDKG